jgi:hypothetical protein
MSASLGFVLFSSSAAACIICPDWEESKLGIGGVQVHTICAGTFHASYSEDPGIQAAADDS